MKKTKNKITRNKKAKNKITRNKKVKSRKFNYLDKKKVSRKKHYNKNNGRGGLWWRDKAKKKNNKNPIKQIQINSKDEISMMPVLANLENNSSANPFFKIILNHEELHYILLI